MEKGQLQDRERDQEVGGVQGQVCLGFKLGSCALKYKYSMIWGAHLCQNLPGFPLQLQRGQGEVAGPSLPAGTRWDLG